MFGYVTPSKSDLLIREYALWRAHYCGLCKSTGKTYDQAPRLTANYDAAFLSLFLHDYHDSNPGTYMSGCPFHPLSKMAVLKKTPLSEKLAAANILLAYYKAKDAVADGEGAKGNTALLMLGRARKRAVKALPGADEIIKGNYSRLTALEKSRCQSEDRAADCFASLLRDLALLLGEGAARHSDPEQRKNLSEFFYHLGRWVYLADALDDLDEDARAGRYNPLLAEYADEENIQGNKDITCHCEERSDEAIQAVLSKKFT